MLFYFTDSFCFTITEKLVNLGNHCIITFPSSATSYLIQRNIVNRRPINFQDPVSNMNGIFHIWTDEVWIHPG